MGRFAISCPSCGSYVTAYNGLAGLIKNKIRCSCGEEIDVRASRMVSSICPSCGNMVMYDSGKKIPKCPVCKKSMEPGKGWHMIKIQCPTCKNSYSMTEDAQSYTCPLCDTVIDVHFAQAAQQANEGMTDIIRYDPGSNDWLVYKHFIENFNNGTQLIVQEGQQALFVEAGEASDLFGPGTYTMDTKNMPWMDKIYRLSDGDTIGSFQSSVYFFNTRTITANADGSRLRWAVMKTPVLFGMSFNGVENRLEVPFNIGCNGTYDIRITNARKLFANLNSVASGMNIEALADNRPSQAGNTDGYRRTASALTSTIKSMFNAHGGQLLSTLLPELSTRIFELDRKRSQIASGLMNGVNEYLEGFGLELSDLRVEGFATPQDDPADPGHKEFMALLTASSKAASEIQAQNLAAGIEQARRVTEQEKIKTAEVELGFTQIEAQRSIIESRAQAESMKAKGLAEAAVMQAKGYTEKDVLQAEVQKAYAAGIGQMGFNASGGTGSGGMFGNLMELGVGLSAAGMVMPQLSSAMRGILPGNQTEPAENSSEVNAQQTQKSDTVQGWDCTCGRKKILSNFCPDCGRGKPEEVRTWDCACGKKGITTNFCPDCGSKRPQKPKTWDCTCGRKGISTKFCPDCGAGKPEKKEEITGDDEG